VFVWNLVMRNPKIQYAKKSSVAYYTRYWRKNKMTLLLGQASSARPVGFLLLGDKHPTAAQQLEAWPTQSPQLQLMQPRSMPLNNTSWQMLTFTKLQHTVTKFYEMWMFLETNMSCSHWQASCWTAIHWKSTTVDLTSRLSIWCSLMTWKRVTLSWKCNEGLQEARKGWVQAVA